MKSKYISGLILGFALLLTSGMTVGCNDGVGWDSGLVGGNCRDNADCDPDSRCVKGKDFPGGTCTLNCRDDADCPGGTFCVDKEGGICLLGCELNADCRAEYVCDKKDLRRGGKMLVCIGD